MIRYVNKNDYKQMMDIYNYYINNTTATLEEEQYDIFKYTEKLDKICKKYPALVYEKNNEILGFAYLDVFNYRTAYHMTCDLTIYIKPNCTHTGIGSKLEKEIEFKALDNGVINIVSLVTSENVSSRKFHEKLDFKYMCELEHIAYKFNHWVGLVYYYKRLDNK